MTAKARLEREINDPSDISRAERRHSATYQVDEVASLLGISSWAVYQVIRRAEAPIGTMAIKVGRRVVFPRASVDALLGLGPGAS